MYKNNRVPDLLCIIGGLCIIFVAAVGILYSNGGERFTTVNAYGNAVQMYGDGLYAFNSVLSVANYRGADVTGILGAVIMIVFTLWKARPLWIEIIRTSILISLAYYSVCLVFGVSMNSLYLIYVLCFGLFISVSIMSVQSLMKVVEVPESLKKKRLAGTGIFLIVSGAITALLWLSAIIPAILNNTYGTLLGLKTTEVTFNLDLAITCPVLIMCGIWLLKKKSIGYKIAPLLLIILINVAILVIMQRAFCIKLGIAIPVEALVGFIISFVIMGTISLFLVIKLLTKLTKATLPS